ncbi:MAG: flavodoxin-dependent (E)-4-hydroxy-3-methylbut-2-enyl-diphosphate synthase [Kiritimatiellae bacterium]|nr:flavodoxin-dependent (E)-4-hydroxy-3-methylbut-2-enyl-diphosphate synthase [Kiritimatiellia bacterium]
MRRTTRAIKVGSLAIGGGAPVSVQTMANVDPHDAAAIVEQVRACAALGCDVFRLTVPDVEAAKVLGVVKKSSPIPLVADIHFDYRCALAAIEAGTDALRLNPGNIGSRDKVQAVARAAKEKKVPIRIGVNLGSLEKGLREELDTGKIDVPEALVRSALGHLKLLEGEDFRDVVISAKASNVLETLATYRLLAERTDCPLHVGVTEAGTLIPGAVRNSVALGILLSEGIGDTIRVSLTAKPEKEVRVGMEILRALGLREPGPAITSCPTCGRTKVDLMHVASQVEIALETLAKDGVKLPRVAVMGCAVNGPGEAKGADVALCGGDGEFLLYVKGEQVCKVSEEDAPGKVIEYALSLR